MIVLSTVCVSRGISGDGVWFPQLVIVSNALVASSSFMKTGSWDDRADGEVSQRGGSRCNSEMDLLVRLCSGMR